MTERTPHEILTDLHQSFDDPELQRLASMALRDSLLLAPRAASGFDIEADASHVRSQVAGLAAIQASRVRDAAMAILTFALDRVIPVPGSR